MPISPEEQHAALTMTMVSQAAAHVPIDPATIDASREFLFARDADPALAPQTPVEQATTLLVQWSQATARGDQASADATRHQIEAEQPTNPFPLAATLHEFQAFYATVTGRNANYRPPQPSNPSFGVIPWKLPDNAKVAIIGDWGTGEVDAEFLLDSLLKQHGDVAAILHLGDIYETGTQYQCQNYFVRPIARAFAKVRSNFNIPVFAVPGDHEYFSGGAGFFDMIDNFPQPDPFTQRQPVSFFCLRTQSGSWQILGGDTGFTSNAPQEPGLDPRELAWHQDKLKNFHGKTFFMTHRQLVSGYETLDGDYFNHALAADIDTMLPKLNLILWGHEHRFLPYIDVDQLGIPGFKGKSTAKLRTLGGSARHPKGSDFPLLVPPNAAAVMRNKQGFLWIGYANNHSNHSYAILDLGKSQIAYYEVTAWYGNGQGKVQQAPTTPMLVEQL